MAFGDLLGTLTGSATDVGATNALTGSVVVAAADLVFATFGQQVALSAATAIDNLGNTYTAQNAGSDAGNMTGRSFYTRVTVGGTLTTITIAATPSANDWAGVAAVIEGDFADPPIDTNPANGTADATSPFTCPATGTLAQADEVVIAWGAANIATSGSNTWAATSPNLLSTNASTAAVMCAQGHQTVAATTTVTPEFTAAVNPSGNVVLGTASFKKVAGAAATVGRGLLESILLSRRELAA